MNLLFSKLIYFLESVKKEPSTLNKTKLCQEFFDKNSDYLKDILTLLDGTGKDKKNMSFNQKGLQKCFEFDLNAVLNDQIIPENNFSEITLSEIIKLLFDLRNSKGVKSIDRKINLVKDFSSRITFYEQVWLIRIILAKLGVNLNNLLILKALSSVLNKDYSSLKTILASRLNLSDVLDENDFAIPRAMLAKFLPDRLVEKEITKRNYYSEIKLDGFRGIISKKQDQVRLFTRTLEELSDSFKNVLKIFKKVPGSFIIDCEIMTEGTDFQQLSKIIRNKNLIDTLEDFSQVKFNCFDLIELNNENLISLKYIDRKKKLKELLSEICLVKEELGSISYLQEVKITELKILKQQIADSSFNYEGLILKEQNSAYAPGVRNNDWLKIKKETRNLDVIITEAYRGVGKRGIFMSSFLMNCYTSEGLKPIGKVGSGFTEKEFEELTKELIKTEELPERIRLEKPLFFEIKYQDLQRSSTENKKYSLRFPVFLKRRFDKELKDCVSLEEIENYYHQQTRNGEK